ncbi:universal stress protein [Pseudooceanicola onchidii]|uniref:universal stress protein n=1 Tax=Pseudooceanicola onchidii TaxID=2562279 RepID=UPI0010A9E0F0|nr:universal stress protein [Pseudooceanicola onchidii]
MTIKAVSTIITDKALAKPLIDAAAAVAATHDAHLDAYCLGVDRSQMDYYYAGANAMILQEAIARAGEEAEEIDAEVKRLLAMTGVRWATDTGVTQMADLGRRVAQHARFSDLVILPKPYGKDRGADLEPMVEAAMFDGRAPVMIVPEAADVSTLPRSALLCWNESREALAAIKAALPLLRAADTVHICVIDPPVHGPNRSDPGGQLAVWLARHGIRAEIDVIARTLPRVSDVIRRHAEDKGAEMIVMGAYGHSRFREAILGGATRHMLEDTDVPVFMAH